MKKNIHLMYFIAFLQGMVFYGPIATLYRQANGVSIFEITLIESISLILCLVLEIPWGILADKIGYKHTMVFCCCFYFISKIVFWQAAGFGWFLLERVMLSIIMAGLSGVYMSILYLSCEEGKVQKTFGIYYSLQTAGLLIAAAVFSFFAASNYKLAGLLTVVSYGLAAFGSFGLTEVVPLQARSFCIEEFKAIFRQTMQNPSLLFFLIAVALLSETHQTVTVFLSQLQYEQCGLSPSAMGGIYIAVTLVGLCGVCSGWLCQKAGPRLSCFLFYGTAMVSCLLLAITQAAWLSIGSILLLRLANSLFQPFQLELQNKQVTTAHRATALSINAMIMESVGIATNLAFGALAQVRLNAAFVFGAAICAVGFFFFGAARLKWKCRV